MNIKEIILNKKLFVGSVIGFGVLCLALLVLFSVTSEDVKPSDLLKEPTTQTLSFPITYYINKNNFTNKEKGLIKQSAEVWNKKTKGIVQINFEDNWEPSEPFSASYINYPKKTILFLKF